MTCPGTADTAFAQGVDSKKMIQMKNFAQGVVKIVVSAANKNYAQHEIKKDDYHKRA